MFKEGDVVSRLVRGPNITWALENVVEDTHETDAGQLIKLKGLVGMWLSSEFRLVKPAKPTSSLDIQHGGNHYKGLKIQPVEYIMANGIGYMEGNAIKYITRYKLKNGTEDLKKAKHYIEMLIENEEKNNAESKAK